MNLNQYFQSLRPWQSLVLIVALSGQGCDKRASPPSGQIEGSQNTSIDWMMKARRQFDLGQLDAAAESISQALIETPERTEAVFLAARIAAKQGRAAEAAELAQSIPPSNSRFGSQAMELRIEQLILAEQRDTAIELLFKMAKEQPNDPSWRHLLWQQLTRQGRRQEASEQADQLCLLGEATVDETQSLIARNDAFPSVLQGANSLDDQFGAGLGQARWHFTQGDYQRGLDALQPQWEAGFSSAAASALYGRLLAESQAFDRLNQWHQKTDEEVRRLSDYWVAVGAGMMMAGKHEAATRAFLEAIIRDPTDPVSYQRVYRTLTALGRDEDAKQMLMLSNQVGTSRRLFADIIKSPSDRSLWQKQAAWLSEMGRPLEAIAWYSLALPPNAVAQRQALAQHRAQLLSMQGLDDLQLNVSLAAIDPAQFKLQPALDETLGQPAAPQRLVPTAAPVSVSVTPRLVDVASSIGVDFQWYHDTEIDLELLSLYESLGGGIAVIDYDLNGWPDLYLAQGSGSPPALAGTRSNELLRNNDGIFQNATVASATGDEHYSQGLAAGDVNQDGFPDLFIGEIGANRLLINNGDGTFRDDSARLGEGPPRFTTSVAIADLTGDAIPELIEANYIEMKTALNPPRQQPDGSYEIPGPTVHRAETDWWYENLGDGDWRGQAFGSSSSEAGSGLGLMITNFDDRPGNEVFVANDARPNHLWIRSPDGNWVNGANSLGIAHGYEGLATAAMGIAAGDLDRDQRLDLVVTNFFNESSNLFLQTDGGGFADLAVAYRLDRLSRPLVGFGIKAVDLDRNGWLDLIVSNGHVFDRVPDEQTFRMPPQVIMHHGDHFELAEVDDPSGYFSGDYLGRAMASVDFDRDGRLDFVVGHLDRPLAVLRNETAGQGQWLQFELVGTESERDATGTIVTLFSGDQQWRGWVTAGDGYFCSDQRVLEIAMGDATEIDRVEVAWPSGRQSSFDNIDVNSRYLLIENEPVATKR